MVQRIVRESEFLVDFGQLGLVLFELVLLFPYVRLFVLLDGLFDVCGGLLVGDEGALVGFQQVAQVLRLFHVGRLRLSEHVAHFLRRGSAVLRSAELTVAPDSFPGPGENGGTLIEFDDFFSILIGFFLRVHEDSVAQDLREDEATFFLMLRECEAMAGVDGIPRRLVSRPILDVGQLLVPVGD